MPTSEGTATEGSGGTDAGVPNNLAILVPSFDPSVDNVEIWGKKIEILLASWPKTKINELATRLILGCKGTAFQKLQLHSSQLLTGDSEGIQKIVELVGGTWGQIPLEQRFEIVERALFRNNQKADETSDSYLSRSDVTWTELLNKGIQMEEIRSYILLRGSRLTGEDKKRVLVESGAETGSALDIKRVTGAIRMLGSNFFQDVAGLKREKGLKTYDHMTYAMEDTSDTEADTFWMTDDGGIDDQTLEVLASEDDDDATLVLQFEDAVAELVQNDQELGALFSTYQDARKRLSEKVRFRGFWSVKKGDRSGKGMKGKGKSKFSRQSLASRIANSTCRLCGRKGHWKNECPSRSSGSSTAPSTSSAPTTFVTAELNLPNAEDDGFVREVVALTSVTVSESHRVSNQVSARNRLMATIRNSQGKKSVRNINHPPVRTWPISESQCQSPDIIDPQVCEFQESLFASECTHGVVDLGASQTVIGSQQVPELLNLIPRHVHDNIKKVPCQLTFRFGNHQTLVSQYALVLPLGSVSFRIAVVPGNTPFLLSNTFLKGIQAVIDTDKETLWSKRLNRSLTITRTQKNLFLMDINQLWEDTPPSDIGTQCFASEMEENLKPGSVSGDAEVKNFSSQTISASLNHSTSRDKGCNRVFNSCSNHAEDLSHSPHAAGFQHQEARDRVVSQPQRSHVGVTEADRLYRQTGEKVAIAERITAIKQMDLATLEKETIQFGKAHKYQPFPQAFEDHGWTDWFVKTYEWSDKESHVKFLTYVEKRLDHEAEVEKAQGPRVKLTAKKSAAKPRSTAQGSEVSLGWSHVTEDVIETDSEEDLVTSTHRQVIDVEERLQMMTQENSALHHRMNGIESALHELIQHVKGLGIKQEQ